MQINPAISRPAGLRFVAELPANQFSTENPSRAEYDRPAGREDSEPETAGGDSLEISQLSEDEQEAVRELKNTDREVRAHEAAHAAAAGSLGSSPSFTFKTGPDGRRYAVAGEVKIDTSEVPNDPEATIRKMQKVRRAALAPSEPSAQDRSVAAQASRIEAQARAELLSESPDDKQENQAGISGVSASEDTRDSAPQNVNDTPQAEQRESRRRAALIGSPAFLPNVNARQTSRYAAADFTPRGGNLVDVFA